MNAIADMASPESARARASRGMERIQGRPYFRLVELAASAIAVAATAGPLVTADKATPLVVVLSLVTAVGGPFVVWAATFAVQLAVVVPLRQRDEARETLSGLEQALIESVDAQELSAAALLLRTELHDIQRKVANVEATIAGHTYADGFAFPAAEWGRFHELIATRPALYAVVERAYSKAHRANELIRLRRTRASGLIGRSEEEDLEGVSRLAGDAIAALNELIGDTPQDAFRRSIIAKLEQSRQSLHRVFDSWQEWFPLESKELDSWLSEWEGAFQDAADEVGGETVTVRVRRWIQSADPSQPKVNDAIIDRIDAAITQTLNQLQRDTATAASTAPEVQRREDP